MTDAGKKIVLLPTNRGLAAQAERALAIADDAGGEPQFVRGEDVPFLASSIAATGRCVLGITGQDLVSEYLAAGNTLGERLQVRTLPWQDRAAVYGSPALCLIGAPGAQVGASARVAICSKYRNLAERYLQRLENAGCRVDRIWISGALETVCLNGLADFIIDIVVTGATMKRAGLAVREVICKSDLALLETRNVIAEAK